MKKLLLVLLIGLCLFGCESDDYDDPDGDIGHAEGYVGESPTLLFIGDSRFDGVYMPAYFNNNIVNYGRGGMSITGLEIRVPISIQTWDFDYCIIQIGVNNMITGDYSILDRYIPVIQELSQHCTVIVTEIIPTTEDYCYDGGSPTIPEYAKYINGELEQICLDNGAVWVPLPEIVLDTGYLNKLLALPDQIHLNTAGDDYLFEQIQIAIDAN